jgi:antitoxin component YwqK of YwqJK toxin-antitoxin module
MLNMGISFAWPSSGASDGKIYEGTKVTSVVGIFYLNGKNKVKTSLENGKKHGCSLDYLRYIG